MILVVAASLSIKKLQIAGTSSCWKFQLQPKVRKSELDIRVFFGYKDTRPARFVADRYESQVFSHTITADCKEGRRDCGFQSASDNSTDGSQVFYKDLQDPEGNKRRVTLSLHSSSVGPDDDDNRKNPFQRWKSQNVNLAFIEALKTADVIFYNGHSRAGGGPDFAPPRLTSHQHIDYGWYQKRKPGLNLITDCLQRNPMTPLKVLGLFSCQSEQLFSRQLETSKKGLKIIDSKVLLYFTDALNESLEVLSNLQELKCQL